MDTAPIRLAASAGARWAPTLLLVLGLAAPAPAAARRLGVPGDHPTIQQAIAAAADGDLVQVEPGTYHERIDFLGKAIVVMGAGAADQVILDGDGEGPVVSFTHGEGRGSVLWSLTVRGGAGHEGGGVTVMDASPVIQGNRIVDNAGCAGAGIGVGFGSPAIRDNLIAGNAQAGCSGGIGGGGISVRGPSTAEILGNLIQGNATGSSGGGISLFGAGTVTIAANRILGNTAAEGGGIAMFNDSDHLVAGNLVAGNSAVQGGGVFWLIPVSAPRLVANTIAGNDAPAGAGLYADGYDGAAQVVGNVIAAPPGRTAVFCGSFNDLEPPVLGSNLLFAPGGGAALGGLCEGLEDQQGNLVADPLFVAAATGDYRLGDGSPAIDSGVAGLPGLQALDLAGQARLMDGDGDCTAAIDRGAYEHAPALRVAFEPTHLDLGLQPVGAATPPRLLLLRNTGSATVALGAPEVAGEFTATGTCGTSLAPGASCDFSVRFEPTAAVGRVGRLGIPAGCALEVVTATFGGLGVDLPPLHVAPQGTIRAGATTTLLASGGSGAGYRWSMVQSRSGGTVDPETGTYRAGLTGDVDDVVQVQDAAGVIAWGTLRVLPAIDAGGCGCAAGGGWSGAGWPWLAVLAAPFVRRRRRAARGPGAA